MRWIDYIMPRVCHICGNTLSAVEEYVCEVCMANLPRTNYHNIADNAMEQRFIGQFPMRRATSWCFYSRNSNMATLMHDLKYRKFRGLGNVMGKRVATELYTTGFFNDIDLIVAIPMHCLKRARRGYNQSEIIALGISEITGIPLSKNLIAKRGHRTQTSMTLEKRIFNTRNIFAVKNPREFDNKSILLVDDVCTTGSTLSSAAALIHQCCNGVKITLLTLGVTF